MMRRVPLRRCLATGPVLAALAAAAVLAGCGSSGGSSSSGGGGGGASKGGDVSVIYVTTTPIGTDQFLSLIAEGMKSGGKDCGATTKVVESTDPRSLAANLRSAAQAHPDLIVANSFDSVQSIQQLSKQYPDQKWALVDADVPKNKNVLGIVFKEQEGMYLLGAGYGMLAKGGEGSFPSSPGVGFVGAVDNPLVRRWYDGMVQGVHDVAPGMKVVAGWGNSYTDPATSKELATAQYQKGLRYIAAVSAAGNSGIFEAAKERGFYTSGVDVDERTKDPKHIIMSMVKRSDQAVHDAVCAVAKGTFHGGDESLGVKEHAVGPAFLILPKDKLAFPSHLPKDVQAKMRSLQQQIASGKITVKP